VILIIYDSIYWEMFEFCIPDFEWWMVHCKLVDGKFQFEIWIQCN